MFHDGKRNKYFFVTFFVPFWDFNFLLKPHFIYFQAYTDGLLDVYPQKRYQPMNFYFKIRVFIATHLPEIFYDYLYIDKVQKN